MLYNKYKIARASSLSFLYNSQYVDYTTVMSPNTINSIKIPNDKDGDEVEDSDDDIFDFASSRNNVMQKPKPKAKEKSRQTQPAKKRASNSRGNSARPPLEGQHSLHMFLTTEAQSSGTKGRAAPPPAAAMPPAPRAGYITDADNPRAAVSKSPPSDAENRENKPPPSDMDILAAHFRKKTRDY